MSIENKTIKMCSEEAEKGRHLTDIELLWAAVIKQAIADVTGPTHKERRSALQWLTGPHFSEICNTLGLDGQYILKCARITL